VDGENERRTALEAFWLYVGPTDDQDVAGQTMRLTQAGGIRVFTDVRPDDHGELLARARGGDTLAIDRLDRLRSLAELLTGGQAQKCGIGLSVWRRRSIPPRSPANWSSTYLARSRTSSGG
jgi:hypothetical protein